MDLTLEDCVSGSVLLVSGRLVLRDSEGRLSQRLSEEETLECLALIAESERSGAVSRVRSNLDETVHVSMLAVPVPAPNLAGAIGFKNHYQLHAPGGLVFTISISGVHALRSRLEERHGSDRVALELARWDGFTGDGCLRPRAIGPRERLAGVHGKPGFRPRSGPGKGR